MHYIVCLLLLCSTILSAHGSLGEVIIGRAFPFGDTPRGQQWLEVIETLLRSQDRAWVNSADAKICLYGDAVVVQALHKLNNSEGLEAYRERITRPLAGLQKEGAIQEAHRLVMLPQYAPNDLFVTQAARAILRKSGAAGSDILIGKLQQWGSLPSESDMPQWAGLQLAEILAAHPEAQDRGMLHTIVTDVTGTYNSGARYGALCSITPLLAEQDIEWITKLVETEANPVIKQKLININRGIQAMRAENPIKSD